MSKLIELIKKKIIYKQTYNNDTFVSYLKKKGVSVGDNTKFFSPRNTIVDVTRPYLLKIGKGVKVTSHVTILTHDFSYSVLRPVYHELINECSGQTVIGDNCFLGIGALIMPGVKIGKNVIIGSGSVVTKDIPNNMVAAGNPAKIICTLEDFYLKRKSQQISDAFRLATIIRETEGREPTIKEMGSFFMLFLPREEGILAKENIFVNLSGDIASEIEKDFYNSKPVFDNFNDFLIKSQIWKDE